MNDRNYSFGPKGLDLQRQTSSGKLNKDYETIKLFQSRQLTIQQTGENEEGGDQEYDNNQDAKQLHVLRPSIQSSQPVTPSRSGFNNLLSSKHIMNQTEEVANRQKQLTQLRKQNNSQATAKHANNQVMHHPRSAINTPKGDEPRSESGFKDSIMNFFNFLKAKPEEEKTLSATQTIVMPGGQQSSKQIEQKSDQNYYSVLKDDNSGDESRVQEQTIFNKYGHNQNPKKKSTAHFNLSTSLKGTKQNSRQADSIEKSTNKPVSQFDPNSETRNSMQFTFSKNKSSNLTAPKKLTSEITKIKAVDPIRKNQKTIFKMQGPSMQQQKKEIVQETIELQASSDEDSPSDINPQPPSNQHYRPIRENLVGYTQSRLNSKHSLDSSSRYNSNRDRNGPLMLEQLSHRSRLEKMNHRQVEQCHTHQDDDFDITDEEEDITENRRGFEQQQAITSTIKSMTSPTRSSGVKNQQLFISVLPHERTDDKTVREEDIHQKEAEQVEDKQAFELQQEYFRLQQELLMLKSGGRIGSQTTTNKNGVPPLNLSQEQMHKKRGNRKSQLPNSRQIMNDGSGNKQMKNLQIVTATQEDINKLMRNSRNNSQRSIKSVKTTNEQEFIASPKASNRTFNNPIDMLKSMLNSSQQLNINQRTAKFSEHQRTSGSPQMNKKHSRMSKLDRGTSANLEQLNFSKSNSRFGLLESSNAHNILVIQSGATEQKNHSKKRSLIQPVKDFKRQQWEKFDRRKQTAPIKSFLSDNERNEEDESPNKDGARYSASASDNEFQPKRSAAMSRQGRKVSQMKRLSVNKMDRKNSQMRSTSHISQDNQRFGGTQIINGVATKQNLQLIQSQAQMEQLLDNNLNVTNVINTSMPLSPIARTQRTTPTGAEPIHHVLQQQQRQTFIQQSQDLNSKIMQEYQNQIQALQQQLIEVQNRTILQQTSSYHHNAQTSWNPMNQSMMIPPMPNLQNLNNHSASMIQPSMQQMQQQQQTSQMNTMYEEHLTSLKNQLSEQHALILKMQEKQAAEEKMQEQSMTTSMEQQKQSQVSQQPHTPKEDRSRSPFIEKSKHNTPREIFGGKSQTRYNELDDSKTIQQNQVPFGAEMVSSDDEDNAQGAEVVGPSRNNIQWLGTRQETAELPTPTVVNDQKIEDQSVLENAANGEVQIEENDFVDEQMVPERDTNTPTKLNIVETNYQAQIKLSKQSSSANDKKQIGSFLPKAQKGFPSMLDSRIEGINWEKNPHDNEQLEQVLVELDDEQTMEDQTSKIWMNNMDREFDTMTNPDIQSSVNLKSISAYEKHLAAEATDNDNSMVQLQVPGNEKQQQQTSELLIIGFDDKKPLGKNPLGKSKAPTKKRLYSPKIITVDKQPFKDNKEPKPDHDSPSQDDNTKQTKYRTGNNTGGNMQTFGRKSPNQSSQKGHLTSRTKFNARQELTQAEGNIEPEPTVMGETTARIEVKKAITEETPLTQDDVIQIQTYREKVDKSELLIVDDMPNLQEIFRKKLSIAQARRSKEQIGGENVQDILTSKRGRKSPSPIKHSEKLGPQSMRGEETLDLESVNTSMLNGAGAAQKKEKTKHELAELRKAMMKKKFGGGRTAAVDESTSVNLPPAGTVRLDLLSSHELKSEEKKAQRSIATAQVSKTRINQAHSDQKRPQSSVNDRLLSRLASGQKPQKIDKKAMKRLTAKNFEKLPEVKKKKEEQKKQEEIQLKLKRTAQYQKELDQRLRNNMQKKKEKALLQKQKHDLTNNTFEVNAQKYAEAEEDLKDNELE